MPLIDDYAAIARRMQKIELKRWAAGTEPPPTAEELRQIIDRMRAVLRGYPQRRKTVLE